MESVAAVDFESVSPAPITSQETAYSGICGAEGDNIQWNYDAASETITFSGTGAMKTYYKKAEKDGEQDFYENPEWVLLPVCNIVFEDGITDIGSMLKDFFHTPSDRSKQTVFLPESVTKWDTFMSSFAIKAPYGSAAYYAFADRPNYSFFGYGIAKILCTKQPALPNMAQRGVSITSPRRSPFPVRDLQCRMNSMYIRTSLSLLRTA